MSLLPGPTCHPITRLRAMEGLPTGQMKSWANWETGHPTHTAVWPGVLQQVGWGVVVRTGYRICRAHSKMEK